MAYDYRQAVLADLEEMIREDKDSILEEFEVDSLEEIDRETLAEHIEGTAWEADSVTGNISGSYFFNSYKAEEALLGNEKLIAEALSDFGDETVLGDFVPKNTGNRYADERLRQVYEEMGGEHLDVTVRLYMLSQVMDEAIQNVIDSPDKQVAEKETLDENYNDFDRLSYRDEVRNAIEEYVNENIDEITDTLLEDCNHSYEVGKALDEMLWDKLLEGEIDLPTPDDREIIHNFDEAFRRETLTDSGYTVADYFDKKEVESLVKEYYANEISMEEYKEALDNVTEKVEELYEQKEEQEAELD